LFELYERHSKWKNSEQSMNFSLNEYGA
jgi:hypothetical protein